MSIPEEVAQLNAMASAIPVGQLQKLSEAELPAEALAARQAISGAGAVTTILGRTAGATEAENSLSHAVAMLDRAHEAYQIVKSHLSDAFKSAKRAQELIQEEAQYHGLRQM